MSRSPEYLKAYSDARKALLDIHSAVSDIVGLGEEDEFRRLELLARVGIELGALNPDINIDASHGKRLMEMAAEGLRLATLAAKV